MIHSQKFRPDWKITALLLGLGSIFALATLTFSQSEDQGIFLSMAASYANGQPLYTGFFDNKDPVFMWLATAFFMALGKSGPYFLDAIAVAVSPAIAYMAGRSLGQPQFVSSIAAVAFTATLSGVYFQSFRTGTIALVLIVLSIYLFASGKAVPAGFALAVSLGFKFAFAPIALSLIFLFYFSAPAGRKLELLLRGALGGGLGAGTIAIGLILSDSLSAYLKMMSLNFRYRSEYPSIVGQDGSILGHLTNINSFGSNVFLLLATPIILLGLAWMQRESSSRKTVLGLILLALSPVAFLSLTAMWPHHLQVLSILAWAITLSIGVLIPSRKGLTEPLSLFTIALVAATSISAGSSLNLIPRVDPGSYLSPAWVIPPEVDSLTALSSASEPVNYARLGPNDDLGLAAFLPGNWWLSCPNYAQYGHEDETMVKSMIQCINENPQVVIVSPGFYTLERFGGTLDSFREGVKGVLEDEFRCVPVVARPGAEVCVRQIAGQPSR